MYEVKYKKIKDKISSYKFGILLIQILNNISTRLVYMVYPSFLLILAWNKDERLIKTVLVPGISFVMVSVFRKMVNMPRPYEVFKISPIIRKDTRGKSFPSRHVFSAFVIATTVYHISPKLGITLGFIGCVIGLVRVLGGVHFTRDVLAGAIVGILSALIGWKINIF